MPEDRRFPVLLFKEIPKLRGKSPEMLDALVDAKAVFPTTKVVE